MRRWRGWLGVLAWLGMSAGVSAQEARYELRRRVRVMERAWETATTEARVEASGALDQAVRSFFGLRLTDAARALGDATWTLRGVEATAAERWAESLAVVPERRLMDLGEESLKLEIKRFFVDPKAVVPEGARAAVVVVPEVGEFAATVDLRVDGLPAEGELEVARIGEGDHRLLVVFRDGAEPLGHEGLGMTISRVGRLKERLEAAEAAIGEWAKGSEGVETMERATARGLLKQLQTLAAGAVLETDVPAARRLKGLEGMIGAEGEGSRYFTSGRSGEFWVAIPTGEGRAVPARLFVPDGLGTRGAVPLVVALHGAGGSENMFFDSYGDGKIVRMCRERGWLLVSPRAGGSIGGVVDALAERYPVDRSRVYLVGHSMGAAMAVAEAVREPSRYAAVAALGGGGRVGKGGEGLEGVRFFVGVGTKDFALRGAQGLHAALVGTGVGSVKYREYEGVEHLAVVQAALGEVIEWFEAAEEGDRRSGKPK